ncbi:MAG: DUF389 domain-containing protein [Synechococcales bacterium]|nr:DUF389 domain-containing protein [Synechococcales bacterium]
MSIQWLRDRLKTRYRMLWKRRVALDQVRELQADLLEEAAIDLNYIVLIVGSCAIATFGLLANSAAVIIGAMIIAPLMLPIRCMAFGALEGELDLVRKGALAVFLGTVTATLLSCTLGIITQIAEYDSEVLARSQPNLLDLGVAIMAGGISGFAKVQPKLSSALAGTAIAVALMPPICVVGLGLAQGDWALSQGAALLYVTNLLGITLACMIAFLAAGYTPIMRARRGLGLATAFTSLLLVPLGISFFNLVQQTRLEDSIRTALVNSTTTFQRLQLVSSKINWQTSPPEVTLVVASSKEPLTPKQVRLLEEFIAVEMERPFTLTVEMTQLEEISRETWLPGGGR